MTTLKRLQWLLLSGVVWGIATAPRIAEAQTRTHHDVLLQFNDPRGFITVTVGGQPPTSR